MCPNNPDRHGRPVPGLASWARSVELAGARACAAAARGGDAERHAQGRRGADHADAASAPPGSRTSGSCTGDTAPASNRTAPACYRQRRRQRHHRRDPDGAAAAGRPRCRTRARRASGRRGCTASPWRRWRGACSGTASRGTTAWRTGRCGRSTAAGCSRGASGTWRSSWPWRTGRARWARWTWWRPWQCSRGAYAGLHDQDLRTTGRVVHSHQHPQRILRRRTRAPKARRPPVRFRSHDE